MGRLAHHGWDWELFLLPFATVANGKIRKSVSRVSRMEKYKLLGGSRGQVSVVGTWSFHLC